MTAAYDMVYKNDMGEKGAMEEYGSEYYYNGYTIVSDGNAADSGDKDYLFYHEYDGKSYLHFNPDDSNPHPVEAWLHLGEHDSDLSLGCTYFDMSLFLSAGIKASGLDYIDGAYMLSDETIMASLNKTLFQFAWNNQLEFAIITLNDEGYFSSITGFESLSDDKDFVKVAFSQFGTTDPNIDLPTAPNADNTIPYWQYKGLSAPVQDVYPTAVTIAPLDPSILANNTITLDIEKTDELLPSSILPDNANKKHLTWHSSDDSVASI